MAKRHKSPSSASASPSPAPVEEPVVRMPAQVTLTWQGVVLAISYDPDYLSSQARGLDFGFSHLEVQVQEPAGAPLPITETGYRSHFTHPGVVEAAGGPAAYVAAWLDEAAKSPAWRRKQAAWQQLDLFP